MNKPYINSVVMSPSPATANQAFSITMEIEDREIVFQKILYFSGEIKSGEKIGVL